MLNYKQISAFGKEKPMGKSVSEALFDVTPQIEALAKKCEENNEIEKELYICLLYTSRCV